MSMTSRRLQKRDHILEQIAAVSGGQRVYQIWRFHVLQKKRPWGGLRKGFIPEPLRPSVMSLNSRKSALEAGLTADELAKKYGDVSGLSSKARDTIVEIELIELLLGTHPSL